MATGEWPMIVNVKSGFSAGNHSVVITARDSLGLTANATMNYHLEEEEQSKQNRMYIYIIPYSLDQTLRLLLILSRDFVRRLYESSYYFFKHCWKPLKRNPTPSQM